MKIRVPMLFFCLKRCFKGNDYKKRIPANITSIRLWRKNMETHGSVLAPQNGSKGRKRPNIGNASIDAPAGSFEHSLAIKRGHYQRVIPECRGYFRSTTVEFT